MSARLNLTFAATTILTQLLLSACSAQAGSAHDSKMRPPAFTEFSNPEMVQILGYDDNDGNSNDAMEPFISRDGNYLFFNSSNAAPTTSLFWATRINDVTFQYQGEMGGEVNSSGPLDAVASMDSNGIFYFITTRSYGAAGTPGLSVNDLFRTVRWWRCDYCESGAWRRGAEGGAGEFRPRDQCGRQHAVLHTGQLRDRESDEHRG